MPFDLLVALFEFAFVEVAQQLYTHRETFNAPEIIARCVDLFMCGAGTRGTPVGRVADPRQSTDT